MALPPVAGTEITIPRKSFHVPKISHTLSASAGPGSPNPTRRSCSCTLLNQAPRTPRSELPEPRSSSSSPHPHHKGPRPTPQFSSLRSNRPHSTRAFAGHAALSRRSHSHCAMQPRPRATRIPPCPTLRPSFPYIESTPDTPPSRTLGGGPRDSCHLCRRAVTAIPMWQHPSQVSNPGPCGQKRSFGSSRLHGHP